MCMEQLVRGRSGRKGEENQRRFTSPRSSSFFLRHCFLPQKKSRKITRSPTQWKNVFPCEASLTTNVPTSPLSQVGRKFQNQKGKRHPSLSLSKSAMKPTRDKSIMRMAIVLLRLTSRYRAKNNVKSCSNDTSIFFFLRINETEDVTGF